MKTKTFDCVEMKRAAALRIHEAVKNLTLAEKVAYWQVRNRQFREEQERLSTARPRR